MQTIFFIIFVTISCFIPYSKQNEAGPHDQCAANLPTTCPGSVAGKVEEIGGLSSYICGPADSKLGVIIAVDIYGFEHLLTRKLADKVGASGYYTVMPDFLHGEYYINKETTPYGPWRAAHDPMKAFEESKPIIEAMKAKGITKIGGVGICWGGKVAVELAKVPLIQAEVLLHPTDTSFEDMKGVKVPTSIIGGSADDTHAKPENITKFEAILKAKPELDSFVKIIPGMEHGWTLRYEETNATAVAGAEEAHSLMLDWLKKHVS